MTTAAQNMCNLCRKSPLHKNHFFEWWKTENFSTAYGTVTLKSPLLLGSDVPHVHQRLRKRLARCTLDCGFKTSESPALRGFVAGLRTLATAALYLVLLSNGLHRPKIRLKKFGFSSKSVPANIAKKLPPQRCFKPLLIAFFNLSHKRPTFAFTAKMRTHSASLKGSHTAAHTPKQGLFRMRALLLPSERFTRFGNPAWPGFKTANFAAFGSWSVCSRRTQKAFGTATRMSASLSRRRRGPAGLRRPTPPAERTVLAPISPRVQLCLRRPAFPLSAFIPGA